MTHTPIYSIGLDEAANEIVVTDSEGTEYRCSNDMCSISDFIAFVTTTMINNSCEVGGYDATDAGDIAAEVAERIVTR